ncbi:MAG: methyl-accepting chemotaxis protein, partial [Gammaproteobacteria bacterium]
GERLTGTLVQCSKLVEISEAVAAIKIGDTGYARLIDNKRRLIAHGDTNLIAEELQDLTQDPITTLGSSPKPVVSTVDGKRIVSYTVATDLDWRLTVVQDYSDAFAELELSKRNAMIAGGVLVFGIFFLAFLLGNSISKPIKRLSVVAETYSKGKLDLDIPGTNRRDEIGDLAKAIERMGLGLKVIVKRYQDAMNANR